MTTLNEYITQNGITIKSTRIDSNPSNPDWKDADHYRCQLKNATTSKHMTVYFSKGYGHNGAEPTAGEVLYCLACDYSGALDQDFETFCANYGYDLDSRTAEKIYKACRRNAAKLDRFANDGAEALIAAAYNEED